MRVKLRRVFLDVDFRHGIPTHLDELRAKHRLPELQRGDCVLLVSRTERQLAFVFSDFELEPGGRRKPVRVVAHYRVQLSRETPWDPLMLSVYADRAGIEIVGLRRFEDFVADIKQARERWKVSPK